MFLTGLMRSTACREPPNGSSPKPTRLVDEAPRGKDWLHEITYDGYRMRTTCGAPTSC